MARDLSPALGRRARAGRTRPWLQTQPIVPYLIVAPVFLSLSFLFYNIGLTLYESTLSHSFALPGQQRFIGLENFLNLVADPLVWLAARNSLVWVIGCVVPQFVLGFALALLLNERFHGRGIYRSVILSPWAMSSVVGALMWGWLLNGPFGVFNDILVWAGILDTRIAWLANPDTAMGGVILANTWRGIPFFAITLLAGLQAISPELYEVAAIDGAGPWARFRYVTLPMLKGVIVVTTLLRTVWSFNWMETIFLMTNGGPGDATLTIPMYLFRRFYDFGDIGYASALAVSLFLFLLLFAILYLKLSQLAEGAE